jgi:transposase-like protein
MTPIALEESPANEYGKHEFSEAKGMLALLQRGQSLESLRQEIIGTGDPYRRRVLLCFDLLVPHLAKTRRGLVPRTKSQLVSVELRAEALRLLRSGLSQDAVRKKLPGIGPSLIQALAKEHHIAARKVGRGRRFLPSQREQILAEVRADKRSIDIRRKFGVSDWVVQRLRKSIGDHENRLYRRNYSLAAVQESLREGRGLEEIKRTFGVAHAVLWKVRRAMGDFEDRRHRNRRILSEVERKAIFADIRAGLSQRALAKKYHFHSVRARALQAEIGIRARYRRFTPGDISKICARFKAGETVREIAHELGCSPAAIWARRKRHGL